MEGYSQHRCSVSKREVEIYARIAAINLQGRMFALAGIQAGELEIVGRLITHTVTATAAATAMAMSCNCPQTHQRLYAAMEPLLDQNLSDEFLRHISELGLQIAKLKTDYVNAQKSRPRSTRGMSNN